MTLAAFKDALAEFPLESGEKNRVLRIAKELKAPQRDELLASLRKVDQEATEAALRQTLADMTHMVVEAEHEVHAAEKTSRTTREAVEHKQELEDIEHKFTDL